MHASRQQPNCARCGLIPSACAMAPRTCAPALWPHTQARINLVQSIDLALSMHAIVEHALMEGVCVCAYVCVCVYVCVRTLMEGVCACTRAHMCACVHVCVSARADAKGAATACVLYYDCLIGHLSVAHVAGNWLLCRHTMCECPSVCAHLCVCVLLCPERVRFPVHAYHAYQPSRGCTPPTQVQVGKCARQVRRL